MFITGYHTVLETTTRSVLKMDPSTCDGFISPILLRTPGNCRSCWCFATEVVVSESCSVSQEALSQRILRQMVHRNENIHTIKHKCC
jgi:hypothetical protein